MPQMWFKDKKGGSMIKLFRHWKPKGKMYSLRCFQCGSGFLSSFNLDAPICSRCMQIAKSLDSTTDYENVCSRCGKKGVIYNKKMWHSCYFGLIKIIKLQYDK
jgi:ribosomal protein L37E